MKCFNHPQVDAVGSCKQCFRGVCPQCAQDTGVGLACSEACASEVKAVHSLVERNKKVYAFAPKTHSRQAILLALMGALFIGFGFYSQFRFLMAFFIAFGVLMLIGAAVSVF